MIKIEHKGVVKIDPQTSVTDPTITVVNALDIYPQKTVVITVDFKGTNYSSHSRSIGQFIYDITWSDDDVEDFILKWLEENE